MPHTDPTDARWRARRIAARLAYAAVILAATWTGLAFEPDTRLAGMRLWRALHPDFRPNDVLDAIRNVALFAGLGAVWLVTADPTRLRRATATATLAGLGLSLTAEVAQLFSPHRMASVLDLITNTLGALLGAAVLAGAILVVTGRRTRHGASVVPHLLVAGPYLAACALEAFSQWGRPKLVPGAAGGFRTRWAAATAHLARVPDAPPNWSDVLLFAPAGFLAARVLIERGVSPGRAAALASAAAAVVWLGAEGMRGLAGADLRPSAVVLHVVAALAGAVVAAALARRGGPALERDPRAYVLVVALWSLRPFAAERSLADAVGKLTPEVLVPLRTLVDSWSLPGVADVAIGFCLYLPIGAWFAVHPRHAGGGLRRAIPWWGLAVAVATEAAQLAVRGRTFDVTDVLVQCAGVLVGWAIVLRADARRARLGPGASAGARVVAAPRSARAQSAVG